MANVNPSKFVELCEKGIKNDDHKIRLQVARPLGSLASIDKSKFIQLHEEGIKDKNIKKKIEKTKDKNITEILRENKE